MKHPKRTLEAIEIVVELLLEREEARLAALDAQLDNSGISEQLVHLCNEVAKLDYTIDVLNNEIRGYEIRCWRDFLKTEYEGYSDNELQAFISHKRMTEGDRFWLDYRTRKAFEKDLKAFWDATYDAMARHVGVF